MSSRMFKIAGSALILVFATVPSGTANTDGRHSESDFSTNVQQADPDCPLNQFPHHCMKTKFPVGTYGGLWEGPDRRECPTGSRKSAATVNTSYPTFCISAMLSSSRSRCAFSIQRCS